MILTIALLQLVPTGSLEGNLEKGIASCTEAKAMGSDIALLSEMWSCGYDLGQSKEAIGITYLEACQKLCYNTLSQLRTRVFEKMAGTAAATLRPSMRWHTYQTARQGDVHPPVSC